MPVERPRQREEVETVDKREDANPLEERLPSSKRYAAPPRRFAPGQGYTLGSLPAARRGELLLLLLLASRLKDTG